MESKPTKENTQPLSPTKKQKAWRLAEGIFAMLLALSVLSVLIVVNFGLTIPFFWIVPGLAFLGWLIVALISAHINKIEPNYDSEENWNLWGYGL